ncbi:hypothetical protein BB561_001250 [Smittium simulii]|uniref:Integrase zinc-binding domain-containing protein n=1 Tax=Smittium simulii TaxID=133385 RepID=A0A2T9YVI2_9FUNG|nr:hypothetical protein BB561_001250 [Smittium simulii]
MITNLDLISGHNLIVEYRKEQLDALENDRAKSKLSLEKRSLSDKKRIDDRLTFRKLNKGDMVLMRNEARKKFEPKWFGPYCVLNDYDNSAYDLVDNCGVKHKHRIHGNRPKLAKVQDQNNKTWKYPKSVMRTRINF